MILPNVCLTLEAAREFNLDITLIYVEKGKVHRDRFATGKTLEESADAFFRMSQIGAECLLMLNGRGCSYEKNNRTVELSENEATFLTGFLQENLHQISEEQDIEAVGSIMGKLEPQEKKCVDRGAFGREQSGYGAGEMISFPLFEKGRSASGGCRRHAPDLTSSSAWWLRQE